MNGRRISAAAPPRRLCVDGKSGSAGVGRNDSQDGSGAVLGSGSVSALRIAVTGRQNAKKRFWYQPTTNPSAIAMLSRGLQAGGAVEAVAVARDTRFPTRLQPLAEASAHKWVTWVWAAVLAGLMSWPISLTSL